jgi:hypothetical protein
MIINQNHEFQILDENIWIAKIQNIKFLGIAIDWNLSREQHISNIIRKINKACFAIRSVKPCMPLEAMNLIYFSHFHCVLSYGIIFCGNSVHNQYIFRIHKRTNGVITNSKKRDCCQKMFKKLQILPLYSPYTYSLLMFVVKNRSVDLFVFV